MVQNGLFPVTFPRHGQRRWKRFTSYNFAADLPDCPVVLPEVPQVAAAFPIIFRKTSEGFEPRAVFSLASNLPNPFVSEDGRWLAAYVPAELRSHPFHAERLDPKSSGACSNLQLTVNETSGFVTKNPNDERFFDDNGALAPALCEVRTFLQNRIIARTAILALCRELEKLGLFESAKTHGGVQLPTEAFTISSSRLNKLPQPKKLSLIDTGALLLIHAHQISLSHLSWLAHAHQQSAHQSKQEKYTENSDVCSFLSAIANAQKGDSLGTSEV